MVIESPTHKSSDQKVDQNAYDHRQDYHPLLSLLACVNVAQIEIYLQISKPIGDIPFSQSDDGSQLPDKLDEDLYVLFYHDI